MGRYKHTYLVIIAFLSCVPSVKKETLAEPKSFFLPGNYSFDSTSVYLPYEKDISVELVNPNDTLFLLLGLGAKNSPIGSIIIKRDKLSTATTNVSCNNNSFESFSENELSKTSNVILNLATSVTMCKTLVSAGYDRFNGTDQILKDFFKSLPMALLTGVYISSSQSNRARAGKTYAGKKPKFIYVIKSKLLINDSTSISITYSAFKLIDRYLHYYDHILKCFKENETSSHSEYIKYDDWVSEIVLKGGSKGKGLIIKMDSQFIEYYKQNKFEVIKLDKKVIKLIHSKNDTLFFNNSF